jgi:rod shape-determining protein MreC
MPRRRHTAFDGPIAKALGRAPVWVLLIFSILLIAITMLYPKQVNQWRVEASDLIHPVMAAFSTPVQATRQTIDNLLSLPDLTAENQRLRNENLRLRAWYDEAMRLKSENIHLKQLTKNLPEMSMDPITARVMADTGGVFAKSLMIRAGQSDGVADGFIALAGGQVIGQITTVGEHTSRLLLLTDMNSRIPVMVQSTGQRAILTGKNNDQPILRFPADQSQFEDGARLVTSGHGGRFPPNLPVGRVIRNDQTGQMLVELFADLHRLTHVQLIDPNRRPANNPQ